MDTAELLNVSRSPVVKFFKSVKRRLFGGFRKKDRDPDYASRFRVILNDLDKRDPSYGAAVRMSRHCDEGIRTARQKHAFNEKIRELDEKISELDAFSNLSDEDADLLKNLLERFVSLSRERSELMYQLTSFDNALTYMEKLEDDANASVGNITDAEKQQKVLKHDLVYLEGEKAELEYEKEFLSKSVKFIYRFTVFIIVLFAVVAVALCYLYLFRDIPIFYPLSIFILLLIFVVFFLGIFKRRIDAGIKMNVKKQQRAVELLNKKNAVYAHYTNYLNYTYKKYRIKNSGMLKKNLKDLDNYKHLAYRFDNIRNIMYQTETQIEDFLRKKKLGGVKSTVEQFARTVDIENKRGYFRELSEEKKNYEKSLAECEERQQKIFTEIEELSAGDSSESQVLNRMLQAYQNEIENVGVINVNTKNREDMA